MVYLQKTIFGVFLTFFLIISVGTANADYRMIVPQKVGGGTSVWATIVAKEMEKYLDEPITIVHVPGARDIGGFNKFHNEFQYDDKTIMVSHGGNGVSFLQENVDYNYAEYSSVGLMNLNIIVGKRKDMKTVRFAGGSGMVPEAIALALLLCGPNMTTEGYIMCFDNKVKWVNGMSGGERRLAFRRGELTATRENPAAYKKHVEGDKNAEVWFHHGIIDIDGKSYDDPNYRGFFFEDLYKEKWDREPKGDLYDAYVLVKSFRDGLQKALWVRKDNPNRDKLVKALEQVATNSESQAAIEAKVGQYDWYTGDWADEHLASLMKLITPEALKTLVYFNTKALGLSSAYKVNLLE